ncbi:MULTISPECIES: T6SS phospholipase effector Tle1-like catalytic domain-containing protein [unclassified Myroides]|uniref:T6SS phospholipase effector Tle1-like catalytic domain-containing protein n=1 Tax=unclassified Myroides TaxID=2642485 RepID=UPI003D2F5EE9
MKTEQAKTSYTAAVFFDGTGNNRINSANDPNKFGRVTNIGRLFECCTVDDRVYIEGVGTRDNMDDSSIAKGTGENPPGYSGYSYMDKLEKGTNFIKAYQKLHEADEIELLVFGFSRGSTLARDFSKKALAYPNVRIKFLGIFDTVVSLLLRSPNIHFTSSELERVDCLLHLTAINETRGYFPLTSVQYHNGAKALVDIKNEYSDKVKEIFVPGAHSDVGGGYGGGIENIYLGKAVKEVADLQADVATIKNTVSDQFSGSTHYLIWTALLGDNVVFKEDSSTSGKARLGSSREDVPPAMSAVYFEVMGDYANTTTNRSIFDFTSNITDGALTQLKKDIAQYIKSNDPERGPNYDYAALAKFTHISSNYGAIDSSNVKELTLNCFDPVLLKAEIKQVKAQNPSIDSRWLSEAAINEAFGFEDLIDVNKPNNPQWHRGVIYG